MKKFLLALLIGGFLMVAPIGSSGTPDYNKSLSSNPTLQSFEAGEDTTRLLMGGGANSRSGRWIWATGFESGLGEIFQFVGTETIDTVGTYMGKNCLRVPVAAIIGDNGGFGKTLFSPIIPGAQNNKYGLEAMIAFGNIGIANEQIRVYWSVQAPNLTPGQLSNYRIMLEITNPVGNITGILYYRNNAGIYIQFADVSNKMIANDVIYHYTKLVYDASLQEYSYFTFDNVSYSLEGLGVGSAAGVPWLNNSIVLENMTILSTAYIKIDNVIITGDEP